MITKQLVNKNNLKDENGCEFSVGYFITKSSNCVNDSTCPYGISIEKPLSNGDYDSYSVAGCFKSKDNALLLLQKLSDYSVTPSAAEESIDVLLDLCNFIY